jgi:hypothetical protein
MAAVAVLCGMRTGEREGELEREGEKRRGFVALERDSRTSPRRPERRAGGGEAIGHGQATR